jgi:hypothetical protein
MVVLHCCSSVSVGVDVCLRSCFIFLFQPHGEVVVVCCCSRRLGNVSVVFHALFGAVGVRGVLPFVSVVV